MKLFYAAIAIIVMPFILAAILFVYEYFKPYRKGK